MGYTNYWKIKKGFSQGEWQTVKEIYQTKIAPNFKDIIEGGLQTCDHTVETLKTFNQYIQFNGIGSNSHETFTITPFETKLTQFCKTNRKPYDKAVWEFLIRLECHFPDHISISNDDDPRKLED